MTGIVVTLLTDAGVIKAGDGLLYVFRRGDAPAFDELRAGVPVFFSPWGGAKGPRAKQIQIDPRHPLTKGSDHADRRHP